METFKKYPVTSFLVLLTTLVFLAMQIVYFGAADRPAAILNFGGMYGNLVIQSPDQLWRLVTPIFVHIGWEHFLFNTLILYFIGQLAESIWGSWKFLLLYILSGIMGNIFTLYFTADVVAAGASTSLFGLFSAIIALSYFTKNPYLKQIGSSYQILIAINLVFNLFMPSISIAGHLGGLFGGVCCAFMLPSAAEKNIFSKRQRFLAAFLYLAFAVAMLFFAF
ncbi:rhomboid family protein [Streptococcus macacae]|uniref:Peptidase, S54 family n=1 Tax=Streptococcus macacae NCTC 11558 TaxID=764298 RepID=G5JWC6_9STRE|nr:rhomboid family intramembrane serine protease [Streptococcus macacae]EHJ52920.1 peptidase, S54 family [Streptococcus macacae NCTC 11558]SUN77780.1 rhomboid family protein [Streptococcus macacae NCTC 11558]